MLIAKSRPAIDKGEKVRFMEAARNVNRSVGAMLSGAVTKVHPEGLPDDTIHIPVSYTHLDVYKRQTSKSLPRASSRAPRWTSPTL